MPADDDKKTIARSIGEFFGHIVKGIKTDPRKTVVSKTTEEKTTEDGKVILRRTTIEEIEMQPGAKGATDASSSDEAQTDTQTDAGGESPDQRR